MYIHGLHVPSARKVLRVCIYVLHQMGSTVQSYIYTVRMRTCIGFQKGIDHLGVDIGEKVPTNYDGTQPSNVPK